MKFHPRCLPALSMAVLLAGCAGMAAGPAVMLVDGTNGLDNFNRVGDAQWSATDGAIQASSGGKDPGYLVTKASYKDFSLRAEFWSSDDANSGIFVRCQDPGKITDENCYEANIFDQRPDPTYGTGAIVKVAQGGRADAQGGRQLEHLRHHRQGHPPDAGAQRREDRRREHRRCKLASGPIALQWGRGTVKFRKVEIRPL